MSASGAYGQGRAFVFVSMHLSHALEAPPLPSVKPVEVVSGEGKVLMMILRWILTVTEHLGCEGTLIGNTPLLHQVEGCHIYPWRIYPKYPSAKFTNLLQPTC